MLAQAEELTGRPAGSQVEFPYVPRPEDVIFDLAVQAAGLVPAPGPHPDFSLSPSRTLTPDPSPVPSLPTSPGEGKDQGGGVVVIRDGVEIRLAGAELVAIAERIQGEIQGTGAREIVVLGDPLEDPAERAMLSWATWAGAAVVLEPIPGHRIATAAWVRPTVFHGTPGEIAGLRQWVQREKTGRWRRGPHLPFRRLRTVLVAGPRTLSEEDAAFWRVRGVTVGQVPLD